MEFLRSMFRKKQILFCLFMVLLSLSIAKADVKLPAIIGDNMVIQRDTKASIWGFADPEEKVTITFEDQKAEAIADSKGKWMINLKPLEAGGPYEMTITGKNSITLQNILVG